VIGFMTLAFRPTIDVKGLLHTANARANYDQ
jgi:hypothetical protein